MLLAGKIEEKRSSISYVLVIERSVCRTAVRFAEADNGTKNDKGA